MIVRERLKNCARSEQVLKSLGGTGKDLRLMRHSSRRNRRAAGRVRTGGKSRDKKEQREKAMRQGMRRSARVCGGARGVSGAQLHRSWKKPVFMRLVMRRGCQSAYELMPFTGASCRRDGIRRKTRTRGADGGHAGGLPPRARAAWPPAAGGAFAESPEHWSRQTREGTEGAS